MSQRRRVRAAVVGDASVGKSSLVIAACSNVARDETLAVLPETHVAALSFEGVLFSALDTSSDPALLGQTRAAVAAADVVLVCFCAAQPGTLESAASVWLANCKRWNPAVPVYLVACKEDVAAPSEEQRAVRGKGLGSDGRC